MKKLKSCKAFTLIELAIVLLIMASLFMLVGSETGTAARLKESSFIRSFRSTISFLYNQAISDQSQYVLNINLNEDGTFTYNIGVHQQKSSESINSIAPTPTLNSIGEAFKSRSVSEALGDKSDNSLTDGTDAGLEEVGDIRSEYLAKNYPKQTRNEIKKSRKYSAKGSYKAKGFYGTSKEREEWEAEQEEEEEDGELTIHPAPNFPSLYNEQEAPTFFKIKDVLIFEEEYKPDDVDTVQIVFDSKGFTDFVVIHFYNDYTGKEREYTMLINPFTGMTEWYEGYEEFEWTFNDEK